MKLLWKVFSDEANNKNTRFLLRSTEIDYVGDTVCSQI